MKKVIYLTFILFLTISCNHNPNLKEVLENKIWFEDDFYNFPQYFNNGNIYYWYPIDNKKITGRIDLYLDGDSPKKPKSNSKWFKAYYYKISNDTIFEQDVDSGNIHLRHVKIMKDTTIGILDYYKIQVTALRKEGKNYQKGLTYNMISKK